MFWITAAIIIILDQVSKRLIDSFMYLETTVRLFPDVLDLTYIQNTGAAWSMFAGKKSFLIVFTSVLLLVVLGYIVLAGRNVPKSERFALGLIFGGGVGNLISRILDGCVIDFINIYFIPIFNVADIAITCGCVLLALSVLVIEPLRLKREQHGK